MDRDSCNHTIECLLKNDKVHYEAVAPYFASSYMTLISIVQSISLYVLLDKNFEKIYRFNKTDWWMAWESLITLFVISIIWHRYVAHTQYLAWPLKMIDTLIPLGFGILQYNLIISCGEGPFIFSYAFMLIFALGAVAYVNALRHLNNQQRKKLSGIAARIIVYFINKFKDVRNSEEENFSDVYRQHFCNVEDIGRMDVILRRPVVSGKSL
jgi:hypothetical protein